jgi:hypothetical protein
MYRRYGQPNDLLVSLNIFSFRVCDVPVKPVYGIGETSGIRIRKAVFSIGWLLVKLFFKRMFQKYVVRDFHPLVFFYAMGIGLGLLCLPLALRMVVFTLMHGEVPRVNLIAFVFCALSAAQFILFAMWFDMESNRDLKVMSRRG